MVIELIHNHADQHQNEVVLSFVQVDGSKSMRWELFCDLGSALAWMRTWTVWETLDFSSLPMLRRLL